MNSTAHKLITVSLKQLVFLCLLTGLSIFWLPVYAQSDIQTDTTTLKADSTLKYVNLWEYAFMMHEETSWLFKIDFPVNSRLYVIKLGFEKKIAPSFSIDFEIELYSTSKYENKVWSSERNYGISASLETRWYYRMNKRVREKKVARNMSDNYLAVGLTYTQSRNAPLFDYNAIIAFAKWGFQRRFLKYGHVDFGVKASAVFLINRPGTLIYSLSNFVDVGLAFTKDTYKLDREKLCPLLKCYEADKFIIKSDISRIFRLSFTKYMVHGGISPHIAFERKIGKSPFSVNAELRAAMSNYYMFEVKEYHWYFRSDILLEGRWYYNLKQRILKGKTGNGLSANYIAMGWENTFKSTIYLDNTRRNNFYNQVFITTGIQRLYSKHMYFDVNFGLGFWLETEEYYDLKDYLEYNLYPYTRFALGYRF